MFFECFFPHDIQYTFLPRYTAPSFPKEHSKTHKKAVFECVSFLFVEIKYGSLLWRKKGIAGKENTQKQLFEFFECCFGEKCAVYRGKKVYCISWGKKTLKKHKKSLSFFCVFRAFFLPTIPFFLQKGATYLI